MYSVIKIHSSHLIEPKLHTIKKYNFKLNLNEIHHIKPYRHIKHHYKVKSHSFYGDLEEISKIELYGYSLDEDEDDLTDEQVEKLLIEMKEKEKESIETYDFKY